MPQTAERPTSKYMRLPMGPKAHVVAVQVYPVWIVCDSTTPTTITFSGVLAGAEQSVPSPAFA